MKKKPQARERTFVQIPFLNLLKIIVKNFNLTKPFAFSLHYLFRPGQHHHLNLTSEVIKRYAQIFKK